MGNNPFIRVMEILRTALDSKRTIAFLSLFIILLAVPLTVYIAGQQQETRSRASESAICWSCRLCNPNPGRGPQDCRYDSGCGLPAPAAFDADAAGGYSYCACTAGCALLDPVGTGRLRSTTPTTAVSPTTVTPTAVPPGDTTPRFNGTPSFSPATGTVNTPISITASITNGDKFDVWIDGKCFTRSVATGGTNTFTISDMIDAGRGGNPNLCPSLPKNQSSYSISIHPGRGSMGAGNAVFGSASNQTFTVAAPTAVPTTTVPPTATPTSPPGATATPTTSPTSSVGIQLSLTLNLSAITANKTIRTPGRNIVVELYNATDTLVGSAITQANALTYSSASGKFTGTVALTNIPAGSYTVKVKSDRYLKKRLPNIITITAAAQTITVPETTLIVGDITGDNNNDVQDYNSLKMCFLEKANSASCGTKKATADLDDDGDIDEVDHNILVRSFATRQGD